MIAYREMTTEEWEQRCADIDRKPTRTACELEVYKRCLAMMSPREQQVLQLYTKGYTQADAASIMDMHQNGYYEWLSMATDRLRRRVQLCIYDFDRIYNHATCPPYVEETIKLFLRGLSIKGMMMHTDRPRHQINIMLKNTRIWLLENRFGDLYRLMDLSNNIVAEHADHPSTGFDVNYEGFRYEFIEEIEEEDSEYPDEGCEDSDVCHSDKHLSKYEQGREKGIR